jgi:two-component system, OmpR family, response regulator RegX3
MTESMSKTHILIVEDESSIADPLADHLAREGFRPDVVPTMAGALDRFRADTPDVVLLDLMLPDGEGRDLCRELRRVSDVPIVMLTARGLESDRIVGLELGADDYVVKPFSPGELVARIRAVLRRGPSRDSRRPIEIGDIRLDPASRKVTKRDLPVVLTAREFDLLHLLMVHAGVVLRREEIMDEVWDPHWFGPTKTLDVHVAWLRKKLEDDAGNPRYITTLRGVGFRFTSPEELAASG